MKIKEVVQFLEALAPPAYQEDYDNAGLITSHENELTGILVSLDCTEAVIDEALARNCNMVVAHHPIVFKGMKKLTGKNYVERTVIKAIQNKIAIYAIHTNLDNVQNGVNAKIANMLGLKNLEILSPKKNILSKLYTFVPIKDAEKVRQALFAAGAGSIGNYNECSYNVEGYGTFKAGAGTNPHVGEQNVQHIEPETRVEVIFPDYLQSAVVKALKTSHPYEEVAYDIVSLGNAHGQVGSGMLGELADPIDLKTFLFVVKQTFNCGAIKYAGKNDGMVRSIAVCGGAGFFLLPAALRVGADVFLTSDIKYHEFFDAEDKITLVDVGHFESEQFTIDLLVDELTKKFATFAVLKVNTNTNPVNYL